jgi:hypothetical protein
VWLRCVGGRGGMWGQTIGAANVCCKIFGGSDVLETDPQCYYGFGGGGRNFANVAGVCL